MFLQRVSEDKPSRISKSSCRNTVIKIDEGKTEIDHLSILVHFKTYQKVNGPASNDTYKAIRSFIKYLIKEFKSDFDSSDFRNININHIKAYEDFLSQRLCLEEITKPSVYRYLLAIVHLCRFLRDHWSINISYSVPTCFRANAPRSNEYLEKDKIKLLIDSILNYSILPERNVAIVLLLLDSGCRAIEITNIKIEDFDRFSSTLRIFSKKSGERKIQVHRVVSEAIQEYILITKRNSETSSGNLFLKVDGSPLTCRAIDGTIYNITQLSHHKNRCNLLGL
ncbi:tyrosine-type recombinase/integrase [Brevibacillus centrosporus]|uniref:Site-specific recombinase XerD n=1 Tax=Brevibacillus centrosporus TaxID=54910 RepID=A0A1I4EFB4_9BACL|nr:site-specific integrase [Brevibacillus centrosporus]SFL03036.1 Site-specific recombinase XerD [Brevibacillus centrosporus]